MKHLKIILTIVFCAAEAVSFGQTPATLEEE
jgi:hypothetical protein